MFPSQRHFLSAFRLFSPLESDDGRHDEALASRIAALNMLDLSLDHLGLVTRPNSVIDGNEGPIAEGLAHIFERVGLGRDCDSLVGQG